MGGWVGGGVGHHKILVYCSRLLLILNIYRPKMMVDVRCYIHPRWSCSLAPQEPLYNSHPKIDPPPPPPEHFFRSHWSQITTQNIYRDRLSHWTSSMLKKLWENFETSLRQLRQRLWFWVKLGYFAHNLGITLGQFLDDFIKQLWDHLVTDRHF